MRTEIKTRFRLERGIRTWDGKWEQGWEGKMGIGIRERGPGQGGMRMGKVERGKEWK